MAALLIKRQQEHYSVSRIREVHLGFVWEKGKGKGEKAVPHSSENCYIKDKVIRN
jgi:hypothetical protein